MLGMVIVRTMSFLGDLCLKFWQRFFRSSHGSGEKFCGLTKERVMTRHGDSIGWVVMLMCIKRSLCTHLHNHSKGNTVFPPSISLFITMGSAASMHTPVSGAKMNMMSNRAIERVKRLHECERHEFWMHFVEVRHPLLHLLHCTCKHHSTIHPTIPVRQK
jgi:hypothetical protein